MIANINKFGIKMITDKYSIQMCKDLKHTYVNKLVTLFQS